MLPTKGYFQDIECPYFNNSCGRPYCHFRHKKKQQDNIDESEETSAKEIPTYKPTPKSELAVSRSHIPISYVPDIIYRADKPLRTIPKTTFSSKPIYRPTPISLLASAVKNTDSSVDSPSISEIKQSIANTKYTPEAENISELEYKPTALEDQIIHENLEKHKYKPDGEISNSLQYNPTALADISDHNSSDVAYKPTFDTLTTIPNVDYKPSAFLIDNGNINFENLTNEFDMIDEIINMTNKSKTTDGDLMKKAPNDEDTKIDPREIEAKEILDKNIKMTSKSHKYEPSSKSSNRKNENDHKKHLKDKAEVKNSRNDKKHSSMPKSSSNKSSSKEKRIREKSKSSDKDYKKVKDEVFSEKKKEKAKKEKTTHKSSHRHKDEKKESGKSNSTSKQCEKRNEKKIKSKHEEKTYTHHKKIDIKSKEKHKSSRDKEKTKQHNKYSDKHKDNNKKHSSSKTTKSTTSDKTKSKSSRVEEEEEITEPLNMDQNSVSPASSIASDYNFGADIDFDDEDETMRECYKIFNEYLPTEPKDIPAEPIQVDDITNKVENVEEQVISKKRIAHPNAPSTSVSSKLQVPKPVSLPTPGQVMNNRLKVIKAMQANNEEKLIANEVTRVVKRPAPALPAIKIVKKHRTQMTHTPSTSLIDDIINGNKTKTVAKKIAPVANVLNIQRAKAQLEELNRKRASQQLSKTIAQTNKVGKRQAHVPEYSLDDIPDVLDAEKSKLPVNVRTRFLTMLAEECCKLYLSQQDAFKRALDEEYTCYQKCKVLVTYRNSAMLAVNRIRKELQEREGKELGPIGSGESSLKSKKDSDKIEVYEQVSNYLLSEEELDIHGYPRESNVPGRAFIKNQKSVSIVPLPKNQKKCSRCSKIYLVDDDGMVIYEEECIYHPLKKRTIRGEQIYLCCKSNDESGCATSHTHVSEMSPTAELEGFQTTMCPDSDNDPRNYAVYALDCEMCYTTKGLELTRVTIVDTNCKTVYESLVKPLNEIIDYNTRFSGITKQQMDRINTGILQVQANILHLCNSRTILIGHSLESDMKALKIVHGSIVDTSVLFPHKMGLPHKRALRALASEYLKKIIQNDISGHDSAEDAITCMELVKWKVKEDTKFKFSK